MLRNMIQQHVDYKIPEPPVPIKAIEIPAIKMKKAYNLWDYKLQVYKSPHPKTMEAYDQNQGFVLYKTKLIGHKSGLLKLWEPHDYALVFLNGKFIDTVYRDGGNWEVLLPKSNEHFPELEILVEGMGHINFAQFMIDRKGITERVTLNGMTLMGWETTLFPLNEQFMEMPRPVSVAEN